MTKKYKQFMSLMSFVIVRVLHVAHVAHGAKRTVFLAVCVTGALSELPKLPGELIWNRAEPRYPFVRLTNNTRTWFSIYINSIVNPIFVQVRKIIYIYFFFI